MVSGFARANTGLTVARAGGVGQPTSVFIRGAESDQTLVVIDGVQINDPSTTAGGFDFENLLTSDVSRIEILRGAQSTLYGSQAIGGVINITTADPAAPRAAASPPKADRTIPAMSPPMWAARMIHSCGGCPGIGTGRAAFLRSMNATAERDCARVKSAAAAANCGTRSAGPRVRRARLLRTGAHRFRRL